MPGVQGENKIKEINYTNNIDNNIIIDKFEYLDNFDRITKIDRKFENKNFITVYEYDKLKLKTITYPKVTNAGTALKLTYSTTDDGFITKINANEGTPKDIFTAVNTDYNAFDQITKYTLGYNSNSPGVNKVTSSNTITYNSIGLPEKYEAVLPWFGNAVFQNLSMEWNITTGNLTKRTDASARNNRLATVETFEYGADNFNRLTKTKLSTQTSSLEIAYNTIGNIIKKYDAGSEYLYKSDKIHAVEKIKAGVGYPAPQADDRTDISVVQQDIKTLPGAGNVNSKYNAFNQPSIITEGTTNELKYIYDYNGQRIKSIYSENGTIKTSRYYFGNYEFETINDKPIGTDANIVRQVHYIGAPNGLASIMVKEGTATPKYYSTYTDHLGSIVSVVEDNKNIITAWFYDQSFDAWGRQRNTNDWKTYTYTAPPAWLYRGYTGHEMLPKFNLINMNGRLYDPVVGRMLSPDNFVQDPFSTQSYNRYSYVLNNPLKYTDPSGELTNPIDLLRMQGRMDGSGKGFSDISNYTTLQTDDPLSRGLGSATNSANGGRSSGSSSSSSGTGDDDYFREFGDLEARGSLFMATNFYKYGYVGGLAPMVGALNYAIGNIAIGQQNRYNAIFNAANNTSLGIGVVNPSVSSYFYSVSSNNNDFMKNATAGGGLFSGVGDGFKAGGRDSWNLIKSLGTKKGWKDLGTSLWNLTEIGAALVPMSPQAQEYEDATTNFLTNVAPNLTPYQWGYGIGYGTEKVGEFLLTRKIPSIVNFGYSTVGYRMIGTSFFKLHPRLTTLSTRGFGFGQFDAAHRASIFMKNDILFKGTMGIKNYNTIYFNYNQFSIGINPWTRTIFHMGPGLFK
jgi:RHS repeat-associated protein